MKNYRKINVKLIQETLMVNNLNNYVNHYKIMDINMKNNTSE